MAESDDEDENIPILEDVLRPGDASRASAARKAPPATSDPGALTEAEIEAIAARVVERHTQRMEEAVARAIRQAIDMKARMAKKSGEDHG